MYGQAVLLRHQGTKKVREHNYSVLSHTLLSTLLLIIAWFTDCVCVCVSLQLLRCFNSSPATDKLAHHIGFSQEPGRPLGGQETKLFTI